MTTCLIVGAGALGLSTGWILQQGGTEISFLVRPHRIEALSRPQKLFSYNDHKIHEFSEYTTCTMDDDASTIHADLVLLTIDGAGCRTLTGVETLKWIGEVIRSNNATLVVSGVGLGLIELIAEHTHLRGADIVQGTMKMLAYQVSPDNGIDGPLADREAHDAADIAMCIGDDGSGFFLAKKPKARVKAFTEAYERSGIATCAAIPNTLYEMATCLFFPVTVASEVAGWPGLEAVIADKELWGLCCDAQREIMALPAFGVIGKLAAWFSKDAMLAKQMLALEAGSGDIDFNAFNRFHHGGKVVEQDIQVIETCIARGQKSGKPMRACRALLDRRAAVRLSLP